MRLLTLLEEFQREHWDSLKNWQLQTYPGLVGTLTEVLRRIPRVTDLTNAVRDRLEQQLRAERWSASQRSTHRRAFHDLCGFAFERGLIDLPAETATRPADLGYRDPALASRASWFPPTNPTPGSLQALLVRYCGSRDLADSSVRHLWFALRELEKFAGRQLSAGELSRELVEGWIQSRLAAGLARIGVARQRGAILCLWREGHRLGMSEPLPVGGIRPIKLRLAPPAAWTQEEFSRVLAAIDALEGVFGLLSPDSFSDVRL